MAVDAIDRQTVELVHRPHPFGVAACQIVVHGHHVDAFAGECVQEHGEGSHQGFAFARRHLGDLAFVEHHAAEELHIVMDHIPADVVAAGEPVRRIDRLVALDFDEVLGGGQLPVEIVGRDFDRFVLGEAAGRILHDGESFGQEFVEFLFDLLVDAFYRFVDLLGDFLLVGKRRVRQLETGFQLDDTGFVRSDEVGDLFFQVTAAGTQFVVRKRLDRRINGFDFYEIRFYFFAIFVGFGSEKKLD